MRDIAELVRAAQSGSHEAYTALIQRFQPMAYATAYRYLHDPYLAQDLVQEALLEAFLHLPQLKEPAAFPGWFRQIIFHLYTHQLRQVPPPHTSLEEMGEGLFTENNPEEIALQTELRATVHTAISALPEHERIVTLLFYGRHYTYNEISALLHLPLSTVKKRLHSARHKLKIRLHASLDNAIALPTTTDAIGALRWLINLWQELTPSVSSVPASLRLYKSKEAFS